MKRGVIITFLALVLIPSFIYANFEIGDLSYSIEKQYSQNDSIKGWINISLENEPANSLFEDSYENSITLIEFLKLNNNSNYNCLPADCESDYSESNQQTTKTFTLNKNQQKVLGFKFEGDNFESISSFSVDISSNTPTSTSKQLFIDILNNDEIEWQTYKSSNNFYGENYGCYESPSEEVLIPNEEYCEKINIPAAPNVEIGAYVINDTEDNVVFVLSLSGEGNSASCETSVTSSGRISCVPDFEINKKQDFFVCVKVKNSADSSKYKINSETNDPCGYAGSEENERDFEIFAKPGKYAAIGNFILNSDELQNSGSNANIEYNMENYIGRYNNNCSQGCIIPIRFISDEDNQQITISNISISYTTSGTPKETNEIYDLTEMPSQINSEFQKLYLDDANFLIPGKSDEKITYSLNLDNNKIFSEEISFEKTIQIISLNPNIVIAAYPTEFTIKMENLSSGVTNYEWDFGDGNKKTTTINKITHTYNSLGMFNLKITARDSNDLSSSKTFNINVKTPKEAINSVLKKKFDNLNSVTKKIQDLPQFYQTSLNEILNLTELEDEITSLQKRNSTAQTDEDYVKIMDDLIKLEVPKSVFESKKADSIPFSFDEKNINLETLKEIGKGEYDKEELYIKSIFAWNLDNINAKITFNEFSVEYEDSTNRILNVFKLKINENQAREDFYFIIKNIENLEFKENYGERERPEYSYIKLGKEETLIEFSTTEDFSFENLPVFISPEIKKLLIIKTGFSEIEEKLPSWGMLILIILLVIFIGFIAYIILQEWYKRKYENYLFKNKNSLYNLISYIEGMKKKGVKNKEISKQLKKSGWNSEQITYIMKKYAGEKTGMFEIPVSKILNLFKKKQNTQKVGLQKNSNKKLNESL
tara:strand:- start:7540 stop:10179 length:2640 start_codon:yes stop_codon:yes gene_type:complete